MKRQQIKIIVTPDSKGTQVFLDGREVHELKAVTVRAAVDEPATVILEFRAGADVEGLIGKVGADVIEDKHAPPRPDPRDRPSE
jgi:hypothetical protein